MPTLEEHACSLGRRGGFVSRLRDGTWMGHVAEHIALELQNARRAPRPATARPARPARTAATTSSTSTREEQVGLAAGRLAVALVNHLVAPDDPAVALDYPLELERLIRIAERQAFGPSTQALIDEAAQRDIPWIRLDRHSLVQLGQGIHQQRIRATMTSRTAAIAVDIASDKGLTNALLSAAGLPVPRSEVVADRGRCGGRRARAWATRAWSSRWTATTAAASTSTCATRRPCGPPSRVRWRECRGGDVVVETYVHGNDYRCLVIGGRIAAIAERVPASVTADGAHTVRELVERENADPRRGIGHEKVLTKITRRRRGRGAGRARRASAWTRCRPPARG